MNLHGCLQKRGLLGIALLCSLIILGNLGNVQAGSPSALDPALYAERTIVLTPGSSTDREYQPGQATTLTRVLTLGTGTLKVTLEKSDTRNDYLSMYVVGYPLDPPFIPSFGVTPSEMSVSTEVTDLLGGVGIVFILTTISSNPYHSRISNKSTVTVSLE